MSWFGHNFCVQSQTVLYCDALKFSFNKIIIVSMFHCHCRALAPWSFHKRYKIYKTRIGCNSPVSALCQLTGKRPLPGRDSMGRVQREIPGLGWAWLVGTGSGACLAETNQSKSRERFSILFGLNEHDQDLE